MKYGPLIILLASATLAQAASEVCRFTLPRAVDDRWDLEVILFHRHNAFHHGYARVIGRDIVPHRVDVVPSQPIRWWSANWPVHWSMACVRRAWRP